ncbi:MAG: 30S ribosomal protein S6 [Candidatus Sumerlaeota bacterium]
MIKNYECVLLMDPSLSDEEVESYKEQFTKIIENADGQMAHSQDWGRRRMAYSIGEHTDARYVLLCFVAGNRAGEIVEEFMRQVRINDQLLRAETIKVDEIRKMDPPPANLQLGRRPPRPRRSAPRPSGPRSSSGSDEEE